MKKTNILLSALAVFTLGEAAAQAQTYNYQSGDLLAAFRKAGSSYDLIVDLGSASSFQGGSSLSLNLSPELTSVFGSANASGIYWSVFGYVNTTSSPLGAQNTLFVTNPRFDISIQNDPSSSMTSSGQGQVVNKMVAIANGATSGSAVILGNQIVEVPVGLNVGGNPVSYTVGVGSLGDFNGTWAPSVENTTAGSTTASDLFQQNPGAANVGTYLGEFTLNTAGVLAFNPVPEPSTWAMMGSGVLALLALRRRK
jgi:hypothetical protein